MRQFVLPVEYTGQQHLLLRGERFHYLVAVLRLTESSRFPAIDPTGRRLELELERIGENECSVIVREPAGGAAGAVRELPPITLYQCLPKGKKMDLIVRQATESGVARIVPLFSQHAIPRYDARDWENKEQRWQRVIREAVQQCGRSTLPELSPPIDLAAVPADWGGRGPGLFCHEQPLAHTTLHGYLVDDALEIALVIGPEGGLAATEAKLLTDAGFGAVYLGDNVLRVETATLFAIAAVRIVLLERDHWKLTD